MEHDIEWRPVVGLEGRYDVSSDGRVRTWLPPNGRGPWPSEPREMRYNRGIGGRYIGVSLSDGTTIRKRTVHQLVAEAFVGPRPPGYEVRHLDGNPLNNHASNLAWGTKRDNMQDMVKHGRSLRGERHYNTHLTEPDVVRIRRMAESGMAHSDIGAVFGLTRDGVGHIVRRDRWTHVA